MSAKQSKPKPKPAGKGSQKAGICGHDQSSGHIWGHTVSHSESHKHHAFDPASFGTQGNLFEPHNAHKGQHSMAHTNSLLGYLPYLGEYDPFPYTQGNRWRSVAADGVATAGLLGLTAMSGKEVYDQVYRRNGYT
jgi:hypothetical protein